MSFVALLLCQTLLARVPATGIEVEHARNAIYQTVRTEGLRAEGAVARMPEPLLRDGMSGDEQRAELLKLLESTKALNDFLAPGFAAPIKNNKPHDWPGTTGTIRGFDLWFAVHADLDEVDAFNVGASAQKKAKEDAGGMDFDARLLEDDELKKLGFVPSGKMDRFSQIECSLLDRVEAKLINRSLGSRSKRSLVVATQTVLALPAESESRNEWRSLERKANGGVFHGPWKPYSGVISYLKASRLEFAPGIVLVEIHGAFAEPKGWFNGKGILKSKISIVANDKIRELRREIAKRRPKAAGAGRDTKRSAPNVLSVSGSGRAHTTGIGFHSAANPILRYAAAQML